MIEDEELNGLFKVESAEHIQRLEVSLLSLEKALGDVDILDSMMRDAHSLKGAARMVEALGVETASHAYEDLLRAAMKGDVILSADDIDIMSWALDVLKELVNEEVTGTPAKISALDAEARLHSVLSTEEDEDPEPPSDARKQTKPQIEKLVEGEIVSPKAPSLIVKQAPEISPPSSEAYSIDTVRVQTRKLDALMTQAGELVVTKGRISQVLAGIDQVSATVEDWGRELAKIRMTIRRPSFSSERGGGRGNDNILSVYERQRLRLEQVRGQVTNLRSTASGSHAQLEAVTNELMDGISDIRLLPLSILFDLFPRMVRDLARQNGKEVSLSIEGADTRADKRILEEMKDPVMHLLRNAIDHGIESPAERKRKGKPSQGNVWLRARQAQNSIEVEVADDGAGLDSEAIAKAAKKQGVQGSGPDGEMTPEQIHAAALAPGVSTSGFVTEISGRGVGLDVVRSRVERLKGELHITSDPGAGFTMRIRLPISLAARRVLLVRVGGHMYGLPVEAVETSFLVDEGDIFPMEGHSTLLINGRPLSVALLSNILEMPLARSADVRQSAQVPCIVLTDGQEQCGVLVDALVDEQEIVVKPHQALLRRMRNVAGAAILDTGDICILLNPLDLLKGINRQFTRETLPVQEVIPVKPATILLVEDSIVTRTQEKRILEGAGYTVVIATDGLEAWGILSQKQFDAVVSDILMPNMTGLELTERIRKEDRFREMPVILVTSLASPEDRKRGLEVGANAYIAKPAFDQTILIETLKRLV